MAHTLLAVPVPAAPFPALTTELHRRFRNRRRAHPLGRDGAGALARYPLGNSLAAPPT